MSTGPIINEMKNRNSIVQVTTLGIEFGTATAVAEAATLNTHAGIITTNTLDAAVGTAETIVITNDKVRVGDICLAQVVGGTSTGQPSVVKAVCTNNTITITLANVAGTGSFGTGPVLIAFLLLKALAGIV